MRIYIISMRRIRRFLSLLCLAMFLSAPAENAQISTQTIQKAQEPTVWMTIFVHGMMSIKPHLTFENFLRFLSNTTRHSLYAKSVDMMRKDTFFFKNQAMQDIGLRPVYTHCNMPNHDNASSAVAWLFNYLYDNKQKDKTINYYYTFGWSGLLSNDARYEDAIIFLNALAKEVAQFQARGITPKIRIIAYSHGGNVTLNLGAARRNTFPNIPFSIDETVLIGVPIQQETDFLVNDKIFKRVYNVYSTGDRVQKLDIFSSKSFFSQQLFTARRGFTPPAKLIQVELRITRCSKATLHNPYRTLLASDLCHYGIVSGTSRLLRTVSPGHTELWFFGWTPKNYRQQFALYPLPAIGVIPLITSYFDNNRYTLNSPQRCFIFDIRPEFDMILVKHKQCPTTSYTRINFLNHQQLTFIKKTLLSCAPKSYLQEEYKKHIADAFEQARQWQCLENHIAPVNAQNAKCPSK